MAQNTSTLVAPTAQAAIARWRWSEGVAIGVLVFFVASYIIAFVANKALFQFNTGFGPYLNTHFITWLKSLAFAFSVGRAWPEEVPAYWRWAAAQPSLDFAVIYFLALASATGALIGATWAGWKTAQPRDPAIHVRGRRLWRGEEAVGMAMRTNRIKAGSSAPEITIHPSITLTRAQVLQSMMIMGAQGGGKTQILWRILLPLMAQRWKTIVFDLTKGDYTASTPGIHRIFALGDARSSVWAIWRDIRSLPDAESFARGLIPESADPMWSNAARNVLVAMLLHLINERGDTWRWRDLGETIFAPLEQIKQYAERYYPPAVAAVADPEGKTAQSIHINLTTYLAPLYRFATEWADLPDTVKLSKNDTTRPRAFSWIDWLNDDNSADRNIILQSNSKDKTSAVALIRAMMEVQVAHIASLEFSESKTRKIFYVLDELPQVGKLECLPVIMEVGRSKGCAVCLAFQDIAQLRQIYPRGEDDKWLALLGVRIFAKVSGGASAKFVVDQVGTREIERPTNSVTSSGSGFSVSSSYQRAEVPVVMAEELEALGPVTPWIELLKKDLYGWIGREYKAVPASIKAIVLGHSTDALELDWSLYHTPEFRPAKWAIRTVQTPARPANTESSQANGVVKTSVPIRNTAEQVNGSEAKIEAPAEAEEEATAAGFHNAQTLDQSPASIGDAETSETRANTESEQAKGNAETYLDIPLFDIAKTSDEPEKREDESESDGQVAVAEFAEHATSEALGHVVGITPELVAVGFELLDEVAGGLNQVPAETVKVMTPAQLRKLRKQQREAMTE